MKDSLFFKKNSFLNIFIKLNYTDWTKFFKFFPRSRVCDEMNKATHDFLTEFSSKLDKLFSRDASCTYLDRMVDHLKTFYKDVYIELEDKRIGITQSIEGKYKINKKKNCCYE